MRFSYFPGCTDRSSSVEYGLSAEEVFKVLGVELVEVDDWNCCGAAATHSLNRLLSLCLPARVISRALLSGGDLLVVPCAGCFSNLKKVEYVLRNCEEEKRQIESIVGFRYDPSLEILALLDVVVNRVGLERVREVVRRPLRGLKVACYYGCALVRHPKVTGFDDPENPQSMDRLVRALGGEAVEWSFKVDCCGADLAMTYGSVVRGMVGRIVSMAREAGAHCIVTSCGLCQMNLEMRQQEGLPVFYFTELMGLAFDIEGRQRWWGKHLISPKRLLDTLGLG
ncbi:MAG: CoB--CoM heterodisulfide reductase iron-sulfur subunit B family protein [Thermodesulfobacteriota bacterium]